MPQLGLRLTPHGRLVLEDEADSPDPDARVAARLSKAFADSTGQGLLQLGAGEVGQLLPPTFAWWRSFSGHYVGALCLQHVTAIELRVGASPWSSTKAGLG
jgi:hypothetical protein